jgi:hypothetical protein
VDTPTILAASLTVYNFGLFIVGQYSRTLQLFTNRDHCINTDQRLSTGSFDVKYFINLFWLNRSINIIIKYIGIPGINQKILQFLLKLI